MFIFLFINFIRFCCNLLLVAVLKRWNKNYHEEVALNAHFYVL